MRIGYFVLSISLFISACQRQTIQTSETLAAQIESASEGHEAILGSGFQSRQHQFTESNCVLSRASPLSPLNEGSAMAVFNLNEDDMKNFFGGAVSTEFPIFPGVSASGEIGLKRDHLTNGSSETVSLLYKGRGAYQSLDDNELRLNPRIETLLQSIRPGPDRQDAIYNICGDQFVKGVEQGVVLLATLKMTYDNQFESNALRGSVSVGISKIGIGALSFIESLMPRISVAFGGRQDQVATRVRFHLSVYQKGGRPERLLNLLPLSANQDAPGSLVCTFEAREYCFKAFENVMTYVQQDLPKQLARGERLAPIAYLTDDYVLPELSMLAPDAEASLLRENLAKDVQDLRRPLLDKWNQVDRDYAFLQDIVKNLDDLTKELGIDGNSCTGDADTEARTANSASICRVQKLLGQVRDSRKSLTKALASCNSLNDVDLCRSQQEATLKDMDAHPYHVDRRALENLPQSFTAWCQLYFAENWLPAERRQTIGALLRLSSFPMEEAYSKAELDPETDEARFSLFKTCQAANDELQAKGSLRLDHLALQDLLPLASLLKLRRLDLSGNNIQAADLWPLTWLKDLQCLDLSDNVITETKSLENLLDAGDRRLILGKNYIFDRQPSEHLYWPWRETIWDAGQACEP